ncbi:hypothetical protein D3C72_1216930 [compost metagenome]
MADKFGGIVCANNPVYSFSVWIENQKSWKRLDIVLIGNSTGISIPLFNGSIVRFSGVHLDPDTNEILINGLTNLFQGEHLITHILAGATPCRKKFNEDKLVFCLRSFFDLFPT